MQHSKEKGDPLATTQNDGGIIDILRQSQNQMDKIESRLDNKFYQIQNKKYQYGQNRDSNSFMHPKLSDIHSQILKDTVRKRK